MVKRKSAAVQTSEEANNTIPEINVEYLTYDRSETKHIGNWITADYVKYESGKEALVMTGYRTPTDEDEAYLADGEYVNGNPLCSIVSNNRLYIFFENGDMLTNYDYGSYSKSDLSHRIEYIVNGNDGYLYGIENTSILRIAPDLSKVEVIFDFHDTI